MFNWNGNTFEFAPPNINPYIEVKCLCGCVYQLNWIHGQAVKCLCGQLYYADPAGRLISHEMIMNAYNAGNGFGDLVKGPRGKIV